MTKRLIAAFAASLLAAPAAMHAQVPTPPPRIYGLVGGLNLSTFGGSDVTGVDYQLGFTLGAFARMPLTPNWSFQPEVEYTTKGARETSDANGTRVTANMVISYVEVPLLFRVSSSPIRDGRLYAEFGPALATKLNCSLGGRGNGVTLTTSCDNTNANVKSLDAGGVVGAGYEFPAGMHALSIGVRYDYGLIELSNNSNAENRNLQLLGQLRF
jgi:hypothetical protein